MFQKTVNKTLKKDAFKVSEAKGKFKYSGFEGNAYVHYLTNSSKTETPTNVLKAVLYTIADHGTADWNFPFIIPFKDPRKLPASLKKKMVSSLDKIMMGLIENNCMDYHILGIPFNKYPIDMIVESIMEVYPVLYFNKELTQEELKKLASISPKRTIVVDNKSSVDYIHLKNIENVMTFPKNAKGLVDLFLTIGKIPPIKDQKVLDKLASILKCK